MSNALTESQIECYKTEGYLVVPSLFGRNELKKDFAISVFNFFNYDDD